MKGILRYSQRSRQKSSEDRLDLGQQNDYNSHSFRIGAATSFALLGKSDREIQKWVDGNLLPFKDTLESIC